MLLSPKIDYRYTKGYAHEYFLETEEALASSYAIFWCMTATGFCRIFSRGDMEEFLFRMAIVLHSMNLVENWLINGKLIPYSAKGTMGVLKVEDIAQHFGVEAFDNYENYVSRVNFLERFPDYISNANLLGQLDGFSVSDSWNKVKENTGNSDEYSLDITPELIKKAGFFSKDLLKFIPEETFTDRSTALIEKEKELEKRLEKVKNLPEFKIDKIPEDIIRECIYIIYRPEYAREILEDPETFEEWGRPYIYLAWLFANDLMVSDGVMAEPLEGVHLDCNLYKFDDGGYNLLETYEEYNLEELEGLLKGLFVDD